MDGCVAMDSDVTACWLRLGAWNSTEVARQSASGAPRCTSEEFYDAPESPVPSAAPPPTHMFRSRTGVVIMHETHLPTPAHTCVSFHSALTLTSAPACAPVPAPGPPAASCPSARSRRPASPARHAAGATSTLTSRGSATANDTSPGSAAAAAATPDSPSPGPSASASSVKRVSAGSCA
eukprot:349990-Chlamydomonas_euryale.AAC.1